MHVVGNIGNDALDDKFGDAQGERAQGKGK